jgi:hypothetical protein
MCLSAVQHRKPGGNDIIDLRRRIKPTIRGFKVFLKANNGMLETPYRGVILPQLNVGDTIDQIGSASSLHKFYDLGFYASHTADYCPFEHTVTGYGAPGKERQYFCISIAWALHGFRYLAGVIYWIIKNKMSYISMPVLRNVIHHFSVSTVGEFIARSENILKIYEVDFHKAIVGGFDTGGHPPRQELRAVAGTSYTVVREVKLTYADVQPGLRHIIDYFESFGMNDPRIGAELTSTKHL